MAAIKSQSLELSRILPFVLGVMLMVQSAIAQPLPDSGETLTVESQAFKLVVPIQEDLKGGHLQGVQLYNGTLVVSGSSAQYGYLALFQLLGSEFRYLGIKKLAQDPLNHAGGFQVAENWLAVGIEDPKGKRQSIVQLIDISSFESISAPPAYVLKRKGEWKYSTAGSVGLLKRKDHFLLAVGSWDCTTVDFYKSNHLDPTAKDFQFERWTTWDSREAIRKDWKTKSYSSYQNLQLTEDSTGVYMTGFYKAANNSNKADVFLMKSGADPYTMIQKVATYSVQCSGDVTFRNGSGFTSFFDVPSIIAVGHDLYPRLQVQIFPIKAN